MRQRNTGQGWGSGAPEMLPEHVLVIREGSVGAPGMKEVFRVDCVYR